MKPPSHRDADVHSAIHHHRVHGIFERSLDMRVPQFTDGKVIMDIQNFRDRAHLTEDGDRYRKRNSPDRAAKREVIAFRTQGFGESCEHGSSADDWALRPRRHRPTPRRAKLSSPAPARNYGYARRCH